MSRALSKEKKKELWQKYQRNQKRLKQADIVAVAGLLFFLLTVWKGEITPLSYAAVLICCVVSVGMSFAYSRCPHCGKLWWRRKVTYCKKCGLQIVKFKE